MGRRVPGKKSLLVYLPACNGNMTVMCKPSIPYHTPCAIMYVPCCCMCMQDNLIRSHASGVGEPLKPMQVREDED